MIILFASTNAGKFGEVQSELLKYGITTLNPADLVSKFGQVPDVLEGDVSYIENARLKAEAFYIWCNGEFSVLADDTGLEVAALNGLPGVKSARFAGERATSKENNQKLVDSLSNVPNHLRAAQFRCVLFFMPTAASDDSIVEHIAVEAALNGHITDAPLGSGGFGYDVLFVPEGYSETLSLCKELGVIGVRTHRQLAIEKLVENLNKMFNKKLG